MSGALVEAAVADGVAEVTLNRPQRHNALVPELLDALSGALGRVAEQSPRAVILAAQGRSFSTGGDVGAFHATPRAQRAAYARRVVGGLNRVILELLRLPVPTIAAVHGTVTGGSLGLVLASDLVIAGPQASFAPWYTRVGFSPDGGWTALLPERIGRARALELQLCNRRLDADDALQYGLVHRLAAEGEVLAAARGLARELETDRPGSVRRTLALTRPDPAAVERGLRAEEDAFVEQIVSDEAEQGMAAFLSPR
ncbi:enoyl-CoA hydratase/isomerase family protein [Aquisalimonas lutea]|uniref:enoyl-CoA hydratase/isomerase family protein n=1 Tax=Aquisalimonas lutea TaxID=1327750 RepID=UPI0025B286C8|nr:enoyl-CoA hydratase/isomerase family protein [Aquisalimonas lutea]MDN3518939.1 enoyl-CoA hydratase/isomerase family protein [Aquisalimonas lutea]